MRLHHDDPRSYAQDFQRFERLEESYRADVPLVPEGNLVANPHEEVITFNNAGTQDDPKIDKHENIWLNLEDTVIRFKKKPVDDLDKDATV